MVDANAHRRRPARWPAWLAAGLVAAHLAVGVPLGIYRTCVRLRAAAATAGLAPEAMRARVFGRRYTAAIEAIRRIVPPSEPYLLEGIGEPGDLVWVGCDLLPRRAALVRRGEANLELDRDCLLRQVRWKVVAVGFAKPPLLLARPAAAPPECPPAPWRGEVGVSAGTSASPRAER